MTLLLEVFERFASSVFHMPIRRVEAGIKDDVDAWLLACSRVFDSITQEIDDLQTESCAL